MAEVLSEYRDPLHEMYLRPFTGLAMGLDWDVWGFPDMYQYFTPLITFLSQFDLQSKDPETGMWHPGASKLTDEVFWCPNNNYSQFMYGPYDYSLLKNHFKHRKADIAYLRRGDKKQAIGIISNKTFNVYSQSNCLHNLIHDGTNGTISNLVPSDIDINDTTLTGANTNWNIPENCASGSSFEIETQDIRIAGMLHGKYDFEYFRITDPLTVIATSDYTGVASHSKKLQKFMPANLTEFMFFFIATKHNGHEMDTSFNEDEMFTEMQNDINRVPELYPNPSNNSITIDNLSHYNFGTLEVLDVNGRVLYSQTITNTQRIEIDVNLFERGVYLAQLKDVNGRIDTIKFIKQ